MFWISRARTNFHANEGRGISLPFKSSKDPDALPLLELCQQTTPICQLNPLLFNGHLQTFWTASKEAYVPVYYKRHVFCAEDPSFAGSFAVDFVVPEFDGADDSLPPRTKYLTASEFTEWTSTDSKPMLITLHGLSGGSHELYVRSVIKPMFESSWEVCVINSRGCAGTEITTPILYNARATWDIRQTVEWLRTRFPNRPLYALGFSLGANILINYLGEEGHRCHIRAAAVVSNPWNLDVSSLALQRTWLGLEVYSRAMGRNMRQLFERHVTAISKNTKIDVEKVRSITYLYEFDRELQCPTWSYPTEGAYYRDASSCDTIMAVRIPVLALNAEDDPIAVSEGIPYQEIRNNPFVVLCTTSHGGHLGWFENGGGRWFVKPVCHFLRRLDTDVDFEELRSRSSDSSECATTGNAPGPIWMVWRSLKRTL